VRKDVVVESRSDRENGPNREGERCPGMTFRNRRIIKSITTERQSTFLSTDFIL
jgi:hypothetical protein